MQDYRDAVIEIIPNGREPATRPNTDPLMPEPPSRYLNYLPSIYSTDDFMARFLCIFESILRPIEHQLDNFYYYLDPRTAPGDFLPWLASWLDLVIDERWPEPKRRSLIHAAVELFRWRGTKRGVTQFIELYTDLRPEIEEYNPNIPPSATNQPYTFTVTLRVPKGMSIDQQIVQRIIETEKPAHTAYTISITQEE
jgi:phage tail-like protein